MDLISVVILVIILIYCFYNRSYSYWKRRNVPYLEPEFFYGNTRGVGKTIFSGTFYKEMYFKLKPLGPLVGFFIYSKPVIMVTDLDLMKTILVKDFNDFPDRGGYYNEKDDPMSASMAVINAEKWRILRINMTPVFTSGKLKLMFPIISKMTDRMIERISKETEEVDAIEMKNLFSRYAQDVIGEAAFGIECNSLNDLSSKFYNTGLKVFSNMSYIKRYLTSQFPNLCRKFGVTVYDPEIVGFYKDVVQQTIKYREENGVNRDDIMSWLISLMNKSMITFNNVFTESMTFFTAGFEPVSITLNFAIYQLSQHKNIREKARKCVAAALEKDNGDFTYDAVSDMHYLEQCINESMRINPAGPTIRRIASNDYHVPNTKITLEKGTQVYISTYGVHHDPDIYPDPMTFNPDRFSKEEVEKRHKLAFFPFGDGPRMCIGNRFAMIEMKTALAKLLMNYEFELDYSRTPATLTFEIRRQLLTPTCGIFVKFNKI